MKLCKTIVAALALSTFSMAASAPVSAQPVAGGVIVEYNNLDIAMVANGWSLTRLLRGTVHNSDNEFVGYVHDAIVLPDGQASFVIVNVAGFLGMGTKLVALPVEAFGVTMGGNLILPNATRENLTALPRFIYN